MNDKISEKASEFTVFILSQDADLGSRIKFELRKTKYDTYFFSDLSEMMTRVESSPPHVIILDHAALVTPLAEVFEKTLKISSEIKFICLAEKEVLPQLNDYRAYNMMQSFDRSQQQVVDQISMAVDLIIESLYRLYQNEQMHNLYQGATQDLKALKKEAAKEKAGPTPRPFQLRIANYRVAETKDNLIEIFYRQTPHQSWAFLKFVEPIQTYISVSSQNMPAGWTEGLSFKIPSAEPDFNEQVLLGNFSESFIDYIKSKWKVGNVKVMPLILKKEIEGLFVTAQDISAEVAEDFSLMSLVYNLLSLEAQPRYLDVEDSLTGFYNELFYKRILEKEIDRSKRSSSPLSVIKVAVDMFPELEVSQGDIFCNEVIKKVADAIKSTSRLPDYVCRTANNEFSIILTNCNRKGAVLRAERLRQKIKSESFSKAGLVITLSQGISEYPTLTKSAEALNDSARKSLDFIMSKGGDKICVYKAPQDHRPDFQVNS